MNIFKQIAKLINESEKTVILTGAGISTESGLPDFRSDNGFWTKNKPIQFSEFIASEEKRRLSWERNIELHALLKDLNPNLGHECVKKIIDSKQENFLITQNNSLVSFMFIYLKYIFLILISLISFSSLYYFGTIQGKNLKFISPGSIMTTILLFLSTYFFGLYIDNFSNYNELYGSIGALIIMMLYIWINSISLLIGFELNVVIYKLKNY